MTNFKTKAALIEAFAQHSATTWENERGNPDGDKANMDTERKVAADMVIWTHPSIAHIVKEPAGWSINGFNEFGHAI